MLQETTNDIVQKLSTKNIDMRGRRDINCGDAQDKQDYITLNDLQTKLAPSAYTDTTQANNITSGILSSAQLPNPTPTKLGGIKSIAQVAHQFVQWIDNLGNPKLAQPSFNDLSGSLSLAQIPTSARPPSTQSSPTRAFSIIYQNTGVTPIYVAVAVGIAWLTGTQVYAVAQTDASNPPTTFVGIVSVNATTGGSSNGTMTFIVLPNNYYRVTTSATGSIGINYWTEWS